MRKPEANDALDRLYAAPLEEFIPLRTALVSELRASDPAAARLVAGAVKPTRTAWAINQVARRDPTRLAALFEARDAAAKAQKRGDAAHVREASRAYRDAVNAVVHAARGVLSDAGLDASAAQVRRITETLQAVSADQGEQRAELLGGRLVRDVAIEDPFAGLEAGPRRASPAAAREEPPARGGADRAAKAHAQEQRRRAEEEEARARRRAQEELEAAKKRVAALEEEARAARTEARHAENEAVRAQAAAERARARVAELDDQLRRAKEALRSST